MKSAVAIYGEFTDAISRLGGKVIPRGHDGGGEYRLAVRNIATINFDVSVPNRHRKRARTLVDQLATDFAKTPRTKRRR